MTPDQAWAELVNECRNFNYWAQVDDKERAVDRIRAALRDYDGAREVEA
ncbi:hypothetical protein [Brachybacterium sp. GU-2]|nr:hypothetical protein [Brachybacterium sp. GU-2]WME22114.1 hypothetical protein RBL05_11270 [Brachybacterium sp. GU-2]